MSDQTIASVNPSQVILWLLRHRDDAARIVADAQAIVAAKGIQAKWDATKVLGDVIVPDLADFPTALAMTAEDLDDNLGQLQLQFPHIDPANFTAILAFITQLIQLFFHPAPVGATKSPRR